MADLLMILQLLFIAALVAGLIKPSLVVRWGSRSRGQVVLYYGIGVVLTTVLYGMVQPPV